MWRSKFFGQHIEEKNMHKRILDNLEQEEIEQEEENAAGWGAYARLEPIELAKPRILSERALSAIRNEKGEEEKLKVLDIGCSTGGDTLYFLKNNCQVHAIDKYKQALEPLENYATAQKIEKEQLTTATTSIENADLTANTYDLVQANFVIPFTDKETFPETMTKIKRSIKSGGYFAGSFFGNHHSWATNSNVHVINTPVELKKLFVEDGFQIIVLERKEKKDAGTHWDKINVIAKKF
jgi:SAM-dependent methyltransferase